MNKLLVSLLLTLGVTGLAQAAGDATAGQTKAAVCGACHGPDGNSPAPTFPGLGFLSFDKASSIASIIMSDNKYAFAIFLYMA